MNWRSLKDLTSKGPGSIAYLIPCYVVGGFEVRWYSFQVICWGCSPKNKCACIFFFLRHIFIDLFSIGAGAKYQQSSRQWIKSSCVTDLFDFHQAAQFSNNIKRRPFVRFINE